MITDKKATNKVIAPAEDLMKTVTKLLNSSLTTLKEKLGEKEFKKRVKKAARKLTVGIKKVSKKKVVKTSKKITSVNKKITKPTAKK